MNVGSEEIFTIVLGVLLLIFVLVATSDARKNHNGFTAFSIASYCYAFIYGAIPIYYVFNQETLPLRITSIVIQRQAQYQIMLLAILGYMFLACGYFFGSKIKTKLISIDTHLPIRRYEFWAFISFIFGLFGLYIEINLQGGVINSFNTIDTLRSFTDSSVKDGINNGLVFFRMFKPFMIVSFYVYNLLSRTTNNLRHWSMSFITFIMAAYIIFINGGRTHIFIFLATVVVGFLFSKKKKKIRRAKKIFIIGLIVSLGVISLIALDPLFAYLTYGTNIDLAPNEGISNFALQFSFPYSNLIFVTTQDFSYRFFQDVFLWIISILPSFLINKVGLQDPTPLYEYNTTLQSSSMTGGGLPDDILTFGYYQLGITGVVITVLIFGIILSRVDKVLISLKENPLLSPIITRVTIYIGMIIMYADLEGTFRGRYDVILLLFLLVNYSKYSLMEYNPELYKRKPSFKKKTNPLPNHIKEKLMISTNEPNI